MKLYSRAEIQERALVYLEARGTSWCPTSDVIDAAIGDGKNNRNTTAREIGMLVPAGRIERRELPERVRHPVTGLLYRVEWRAPIAKV